MKRVQKYIRMVFAVYMALHFLCNAALMHNHVIDGQNISHAHPFRGVHHTADEAHQICLFNITPVESAETAYIPEFTLTYLDEIVSFVPDYFASCKTDAASLRGPPSIQF